MSSFNENYVEIYDLLYQTKDYDYECIVIDQIIKEFRPGSMTVIDYGCGTGNHTVRLVDKGYTLYGIDRNERMLSIAKKKCASKPKTHFYTTDSRDDVSPHSVDVVIALFDVLSYMNTNSEINEFLTYVNRVLIAGGLFIFDFWYGPGVIHQKPEKRWKECELGETRMLRLTTPEHDTTKCVVNVTHDVLLFKGDTVVKRFKDIHTMRYFFENEVRLFLEFHGFDALRSCPWGNLDVPLTENDWSGMVIGRSAG